MGGMRGSTHKRLPVALKLPQLQNLVKRDKDGYKDEFGQQHRNYLSELEIFKLKPSKESDRFAELVTFMSHVAPCYREEAKDFGPQIKALLEQHAPVLHPSIRTKLVQALVLLRNRGVVDPIELITLLFSIFPCQDKALRAMIYDHIVSDIKNINEKGKNPKLNKAVQNLVFSILKDDSELAAKKSLDVMVELYRKRVWVDARTVNVIASALDAETPKLFCTALNFFLNIDVRMADDDDEELVAETRTTEVNRHQHSKKTSKRVRGVVKQVKTNKKKNKAANSDGGGGGGLFPAINLLHDPQAAAEKVFRRLRQSKQRFEIRLLMMNFISRVIGGHRLLVLPFYSHLQRYVVSQQREVTHILAYLVQACHDLVPPNEVMSVVKAIAYNFVTERCPGEVMALGINSICEVAKRIPALLEEENMDALVLDLAAYSKHRDKSVVIAARGFINFVRETYPTLLKSRDRGKVHDVSARPFKYGEQHVAEGVDGAELLTLHEKGLLKLGEEGEDGGEDHDEDDDEVPELVALEESAMDVVDEADEERPEDSAEGDGTGEVGRRQASQHGEKEEDDGTGGGKRARHEDDCLEDSSTVRKRARMEDSRGVDGEESDVEGVKGRLGNGVDEVVMEEKDGGDDDDDDEEDDGESDDGDEKDGDDDEEDDDDDLEEDDDDSDGNNDGGDGDNKEDEVTGQADEKEQVGVACPERSAKGRVSKAKLAREAKKARETSEASDSKAPPKVLVPAKERVDSTRILTAEDFEKIKLLKRQVAMAKDRKLRGKTTGEEDADSSGEDEAEGGARGESFAVQPGDLEGYRKRRRATLEDRLESIVRGREKFEHNTHAGGLTNLEKKRKKNYLMVRKGGGMKGKTKLGAKQVMEKRKKGVKMISKRDRRKKRRT